MKTVTIYTDGKTADAATAKDDKQAPSAGGAMKTVTIYTDGKTADAACVMSFRSPLTRQPRKMTSRRRRKEAP